MSKPKGTCPKCQRENVDGRHTTKCRVGAPPAPATAAAAAAPLVLDAVKVLRELAGKILEEAEALRRKARRIEELAEEVGRL